MRVNEGSSSPARSGPPLYAQFNSQGALDMPATLLTIAARFEKLERWTVGHVRALEERMDDVERWLVEKEKEKEKSDAEVKQQRTGEPASSDGALGELPVYPGRNSSCTCCLTDSTVGMYGWTRAESTVAPPYARL